MFFPVSRSLAKDRKDRQATIEEFLDELRAALKNFSNEEQAQLLKLMNKLFDSLEAESEEREERSIDETF